MKNTRGTYTRVVTYASGKRVRLTLTDGDRVIDKEPIHSSRAHKTKTARRLAKRKRRISR